MTTPHAPARDRRAPGRPAASILALALWAAPLALPGTAQDAPAEAPAQDADAGWRDYDGVAMIVNDDIVTLRELDRLLRDARGRAETTTSDDTAELLLLVAEDAVTQRLWIQAGERIGIPSESVEDTIDRYLRDTRRDLSPQETADWMAEAGAKDLTELRDDTRDQLYRTFWIQATRGEPTGGLRAAEDRFVRPGQLREAYLVNEDALVSPPTVIFQFLALSSAAWGDAEIAREALEGMRADILEGADMGALVDEYGWGLRETRGITERIAISDVDDDQLKEFAEGAEEGALSGLLPILGPSGEVQGYRLARIVSRTTGLAAPSFEDATIQTGLGEQLRRGWDTRRLELGSERLWRSAFIRTPPALQLRAPWERTGR